MEDKIHITNWTVTVDLAERLPVNHIDMTFVVATQQMESDMPSNSNPPRERIFSLGLSADEEAMQRVRFQRMTMEQHHQLVTEDASRRFLEQTRRSSFPRVIATEEEQRKYRAAVAEEHRRYQASMEDRLRSLPSPAISNPCAEISLGSSEPCVLPVADQEEYDWYGPVMPKSKAKPRPVSPALVRQPRKLTKLPTV